MTEIAAGSHNDEFYLQTCADTFCRACISADFAIDVWYCEV